MNKDFSELGYGFSKSNINQLRRSLYDIKNQKDLSTPEVETTEENLIELEESLSSLKKYYDYDDTNYRGLKDKGTLFNGNLFNGVVLNEIDEDCYKPTKTKSVFTGNYIEYESKGYKDKNLSRKEYANMIRPYLSSMIKDHQTQSEWKTQLTMQINFVTSKGFEENRTAHTKSYNIEIMTGSKTDENMEKLFESLL